MLVQPTDYVLVIWFALAPHGLVEGVNQSGRLNAGGAETPRPGGEPGSEGLHGGSGDCNGQHAGAYQHGATR